MEDKSGDFDLFTTGADEWICLVDACDQLSPIEGNLMNFVGRFFDDRGYRSLGTFLCIGGNYFS